MKKYVIQFILGLSMIVTSYAYPQQDSLIKAKSLLKYKLQSFESSYTYSNYNINHIKMNVQQTNATASFALFSQLNNGLLDFLLAKIDYRALMWNGNKEYFGGFGPRSFHAVSIPLIFKKSVSPKYSFTLSFTPTLASDMKDISQSDLLYTAIFNLIIQKSNKFAYSLGALYSHQFYGELLLPIIGIDWNITNRLILSGSFPISQSLKYRINDSNTIGLDAKLGIGGQSYRLSEKFNSSYIQFQQSNFSIFYDHKFVKHLKLQVHAGYNLSQKIGLYSKDQKVNLVPFNDINSRSSLIELSKPGITFGTSLSMRF